ncbi:LPXTG cell wall anchor domain-containing protein [Vagococcus hydrophili]|uniref:LPXTG cell wall anchor domain-containing protein n=1 Tax=Vagococcus hydrophili TaxID=2714947 RepID=A0A6G8AQ13_9ENTE|nr:LPXTG cell wall anchor domain-containing protein [Vagococcus hydrophili]QIL47077.1 LPXTG cell wall anchor domain-containing protein [Vagococcus hydrophili]
MKKSLFGLILGGTLLFSATAYAENLVKDEISKPEKTEDVQNNKVKIDVKESYSIDQSKIELGKSTQLHVSPIMGVELEGTFGLVNENDLVKVSETGEVKSLKVGKTKIAPTFKMSEKTKKEIKQAYIKQPGNENIKEEDIEFVVRENLQLIPIEIVDSTQKSEHKIDITPQFIFNQKKLEVGNKETIKVAPILGVELKGEFKNFSDKYLQLSTTGEVTALKPNSKAVLSPEFIISEGSLKEIKQAYIKQSGHDNIKEDEIVFIQKDVRPLIQIEIPLINMGVFENYTINKTKLSVGETGQVTVKYKYDIKYIGKFTPIKNEFIEMNENGEFKALKAGKTTIVPIFKLSEEGLTELKKEYIKENNLKNIDVEDLTEGPRPTKAPTFFAIEILPTNTGNANKDNGKTYASVNKKLPQTNERTSLIAQLVGSFTVLGTTILYLVKKRK